MEYKSRPARDDPPENLGAEIKLHQTKPVLVVEVDNRQIALENSIGDEINVWKPVER